MSVPLNVELAQDPDLDPGDAVRALAEYLARQAVRRWNSGAGSAKVEQPDEVSHHPAGPDH